MQTYNSFNELAAAQCSSPLVSSMSVFNGASADFDNALKAYSDAVKVAERAKSEMKDKRKEAITCAIDGKVFSKKEILKMLEPLRLPHDEWQLWDSSLSEK